MRMRAWPHLFAGFTLLSILSACDSVATTPDRNREQGMLQAVGYGEIPVREGETGSGYILDANAEPVQVDYIAIDGRAIVGGDMDFGPVTAIFRSAEEALRAAQRQADANRMTPSFSNHISGTGARWPDNGTHILIPYTVTANPVTGAKYTSVQWNNVQRAINRIHEQTRVRFIQRTTEPNYVRIYPGGDFCDVGRRGGAQACKPSGNVWQTAMHELGHAIGLHHEHQRWDRNTHIVVDTTRIQAGLKGEYKIFGESDATPSGSYDFASLMHYGPTQWAATPGQHVMEPNRNTYPEARLWAGNCNDARVYIKPWGCRDGFSPGDVAGIEAMYATPYNASFRSQRVPSMMEAGRDYIVTITMENRGTNTWLSAEGYKLGSQNPQDNGIWGTGRAALSVPVSRGQTAALNFRIKAPVTAGRYSFQWRMLREGVTWFGEPSANLIVDVRTPVTVVSMMHGKCLDAPSAANGTRVHMWDCIIGNPNQRWIYSAATGEVKVHGEKCLDGWTGRLLDPVVVHDCHGGANQQWDVTAEGNLRLRHYRDPSGRPLCLDIAQYSRGNGAQELLYTCHSGENQLWRQDTQALGGSVVSIATAMNRGMCMDAPAATRGTELHLWDCLGPGLANQRFRRTPGRLLTVHGKCVDGHNGRAYDPVKLWDCHGGANQQWDLTAAGELRGVNNLCIDVRGASSARGTRMMLHPCHGGANQRWAYRDPSR
jgi:hypothetical protein